MPWHPKVDGLTDNAFRMLIKLICAAAEHGENGLIPDLRTDSRGRFSSLGYGSRESWQLLRKSGLVDKIGSEYFVHDFLDYQEGKREREARANLNARKGLLGMHRRWHVGRKVVSPDCDLCRRGVI